MSRRILIVAAALLAFAWSRPVAQAPVALPLFVAAPPVALPARAPAQSRRDIVRERVAGVAMAALDRDRLALDLFPGLSLQAELTRREAGRDGSMAWSGHVPGEPLSTVTFVREGDVLQGSIRLLGSAFSIEPIGRNGHHAIRQLDLTQLGDELDPLPSSPVAFGGDQAAAIGGYDTVIDVLAVYTAAAVDAAGGSDAAIQARIALGVAETNIAFTKSGVRQRIRLVGAEPVDYVESSTDITIDLERITSAQDGFMDAVHARREELGADLVQLIVGSVTNGCGVAWLMSTATASFASTAFSVSAYPCISPNYTFGHELAHNMGSTHAPDDPSTAPLFPYSYGYKHPGGLFRTVMAYATGCNCPRVLHFSNPARSFDGAATGATYQDNARSLNNTRAVVAGFRQSPDLPGAPGNFSVSASGTAATFAWTPPATGLPPFGYVIEAGSAPGLADLAILLTGGAVTSYTVRGVPQGTYFLRVRAQNEAGTGPASGEASLVMTPTGECTALPGAPVQLAPVVSGNNILLAWSAPVAGGAVDSYVVAAGSSPGAANLAVIDTGSLATSFQASAPSGTYFVRVGARNACGIGTPSNEVSFTAGPLVPAAPSGLGFSLGPGRVVTLTWTAPTTGEAPTSYTVEAGSAPGLSNLAVLPTGSVATTLTVTAPPGTYFVRVRATTSAGASAPSNEVFILVP